MHLFECNCNKGNYKFNGKSFVCTFCGKTKDTFLNNKRNKIMEVEVAETSLMKFSFGPGDKLIISQVKSNGETETLEREFPNEENEDYKLKSVNVELLFKATINLENK